MITIDYCSDALCVWAYGGQVRLDELRTSLGVPIDLRRQEAPKTEQVRNYGLR